MSRLEEIVSLLERGDATLGDSMALFEEGTKLVNACRKELDTAEQKVVKLSRRLMMRRWSMIFAGGLSHGLRKTL